MSPDPHPLPPARPPRRPAPSCPPRLHGTRLAHEPRVCLRLSPCVSPHVGRAPRGFTLIGALLCVLILSIVALIALPSFQATLRQHRLETLAADFAHDLQLARSLAISGQQALRLSVLLENGGSCYVLHSAAHDQCHCSAAAASCLQEGPPIRYRWIATGSRTRITANVPGVTLHAGEGFVTSAGTFRVEDPGAGRAIWYVVSPLGRVRPCSQGWSSLMLPPCGSA